VRDVVGPHLNPPDRALVLSVDEKPQIQATTGTAPVLPTRPGQPSAAERRTHDYVRHGTRDLFAAPGVKAGTVLGEVHPRHRSEEFRHFLDTVDAHTPPEFDLHLILDNSAMHETALVKRWVLRHPRVHLHFTPTGASWINLVECWFSLLQRRALARAAFASTDALDAALHAYIAATNADPKPFVWTKSADEILAAVRRFCQRTSGSDR
jgi:transposase